MRSVLRIVVPAAAASLAVAGLLAACQSYEFEEVKPKAIEAVTNKVPSVGKQQPPKIMLVVDKSGSMTDATANPNTSAACTVTGQRHDPYSASSSNGCKWKELSDAIAGNGKFLDLAGSMARFGLAVFPSVTADPNNFTECEAGDIVVPVSSSAGGSTASIKQQLLSTIKPSGGTPTTKTLEKLLNNSAFVTAEPNTKSYIMLLTDGLPNCNPDNGGLCKACRDSKQNSCGNPPSMLCELPDTNPGNCCSQSLAICEAPTGCRPTVAPFDSCGNVPFDGAFCLDEQKLVDVITKFYQKDIHTFVIGFGTETGAGDAGSVLSRAANAGGEPRAGATSYYQANNVTELKTILEEIQKKVLSSCSFSLNPPPEANELVKVFLFDPKTSEEQLLASGTDYTLSGSSIELKPERCTTYQQTEGLEIQIRYANGM